MIGRSILKAAAGTLGCVAVFLAVVLMSMPHGPRFSPQRFPGVLIASGGNGGGASAGTGSKTFMISGSVVDLYPGAHKTLTLRFDNANNQAIRVTAVTVTVQSTNKPGCPTTDVASTNYQPAPGTGVVVAKNS